MPAAHPYSVGIGCCLFDRLEKVVVDQAENIVVVISPTETAFFNRMDRSMENGEHGRLWRHFCRWQRRETEKRLAAFHRPTGIYYGRIMVWTKEYVSVYPEMGALIMKRVGNF